jgi:hypothetical protein
MKLTNKMSNEYGAATGTRLFYAPVVENIF